MAPYSLDLREKVISHYHRFGNKAGTSRVFGIHRDTITNWLEKAENGGSLAALKSGPKSFRKVDPIEVRAAISENPNMTLHELGERFRVSHVAIWKILRKLRFVYKKKFYVQGAERRRAR